MVYKTRNNHEHKHLLPLFHSTWHTQLYIPNFPLPAISSNCGEMNYILLSINWAVKIRFYFLSHNSPDFIQNSKNLLNPTCLLSAIHRYIQHVA